MTTSRPSLSLLLLLLAAIVLLSGCIVRTRGHSHGHHHSSRAAPAPRCHPSQYWDGNQCRHKGRGHGARKHDGRR